MHLNAHELVDLAEGARPESSAPHLAACERCRAELADLRAMRSAVADVEVPAPSPLFWDHFSQRVHDAVAAEEADARGTARLKGSRSIVPRVRSFVPRVRSFVPMTMRSFVLDILGARAFQASVVAIAALVVVFVFNSRVMAPHAPGLAPPPPPLVARDLLSDVPEGDASLSLVATLAASLDADTAGESGLAHVGSAEHAVTHMNDSELRELHRLLQEEMAP
jgi:anti-sigma factor RsiW